VDAAVRKHLFTVEEFHRMGEAGLFGEERRVELMDGEVLEMSPPGGRHIWAVNRINGALVNVLGGRYEVSVQNPLVLGERFEPQPDLVLLRRDLSTVALPTSSDALLVIEVSDTTLRYDRETKLPLYAAAGIPEAWIVDLQNDEVEGYSEPRPEGYRTAVRRGRGQQVASATFPGLAFDVAEVLPPRQLDVQG
jgi:Uma2 family endonuclease